MLLQGSHFLVSRLFEISQCCMRAVCKMGKDTVGVFSNNMDIKEAGLGRVILGRFVSPEQCLELVIII